MLSSAIHRYIVFLHFKYIFDFPVIHLKEFFRNFVFTRNYFSTIACDGILSGKIKAEIVEPLSQGENGIHSAKIIIQPPELLNKQKSKDEKIKIGGLIRRKHWANCLAGSSS